MSLVGLWVFLSVSAAASKPSIVLLHSRGQGATQCPDDTALKRSVTARLGFDPFVMQAPLRAVTSLEHDAQGFHATLQLLKEGDTPRQRILSSEDCEELTQSLSLALALAIDPQLMTREAPVVPPPVTPTPVAQTVSYPVFFRFAAGGQAAIGLSPTVTPGLFAAVGFRYRRFELYGEGRFDAASAVEVTLGKVWVRPIAAFILPCVASPWGLSACAQLGAGALQVEGQVSFGNKDTTPLFFAGLRLQYEYLTRWGVGLVIRLSVQAVPTRVTVYVAEAPVWVTSPVVADLGFGLTGLY